MDGGDCYYLVRHNPCTATSWCISANLLFGAEMASALRWLWRAYDTVVFRILKRFGKLKTA